MLRHAVLSYDFTVFSVSFSCRSLRLAGAEDCEDTEPLGRALRNLLVNVFGKTGKAFYIAAITKGFEAVLD